MSRLVRLLLSAVLMLGLAQAQAAEWRLVKDEGGIQVYLQRVAGSSYQAFRGVTRMRAEMPRLLALQEDVGAACAWIHACIEQKLLRQQGDLSWTYTRFYSPWPVKPRDSVLQIATRRGADGSVTRILRGVADYLPVQPGFVRVSKVEGQWILTPQEGGEVEVVYQLYSEPGGSVPSWLANSFVVDAPFNTLQALRQLAEQP